MSRIHLTTHLGAPLYLWLLPPQGQYLAEIGVMIDTRIDEGSSRRENRRPVFENIRLSQAVEWTLFNAADGNAFVEALATLNVEPIGVPLWADAVRPADWATRIFSGNYAVAWDDDGAWEILLSSTVTSGLGYTYVAPLLVGRLERRPSMEQLGGAVCRVRAKIIENTPWDERISPNAIAVGSNWPDELVIDWGQGVRDETDDILEYEQIGDGRLIAVEMQEGQSRRVMTGTLTLSSRDDMRRLVSFWSARKGQTEPFVIGTLYQPGESTPTAPHITGVRFDQSELRLRFEAGALCRAEVRFTQLPWEIVGVAGETAVQPARTFLYQMTALTPTPVNWRWTAYERPLTRIEGTYSPAIIEHDSITRTIDLSDSAPKIIMWAYDGNPLLLVLRQEIDVPLEITIYEADPANPAAATLVFYGEIDSVAPQGRRIEATCSLLGGALKNKVPRFTLGKNCNYRLGGPGCGRNIADWTNAATLVALEQQPSGVIFYRVSIGSTAPAGKDLVDDWFANGYVAAGDGLTYELRRIVRSAKLSATEQILILDRGFRSLTVGGSLSIVPHCAGTWNECRNKFNLTNEWHNFGGHRLMPKNNPSVPTRPPDGGGAKK